MSSKKRITSWQRELYQHSYRWIRSFDSRRSGELLKTISIGTEDRQAIFGRALISHQCREMVFAGWQNLTRRALWRVYGMDSVNWTDIPF